MKKHCLLAFFTLLNILVFGQKPTANFSVQQAAGCAPLVVNFQDLSSNNPTSWQWDFGNGATSTLQNPSAVYFTPGTYSITLIAANTDGSDTLIRAGYITVYGKPQVDFSVPNTNGCYPFAVTFTDASVASPGTTNVSWQWDLGNGVQSLQPSPQTVYTTAGDYNVSLKLTNDKGCFAILSKAAYVHIPGGLNLSFSNTAVNRCRTPVPVSFTNTSTGPGSLSYLWDFGDGSTSTQQNANHAYTTPGTYSVSLAITSNQGCTDTLRKQNIISIQNISTSFTAPESVCMSTAAPFVNTSSAAPAKSSWNFADGTIGSTVNVNKTYTTAGTYNVRLYNTYSYCTDSFAKTIQVLPKPKAAFSANQTTQCQPPLTISFTDASAGAASWQWDFGDGATSTQQNPTHTYTNYGNYNVVLTVTNNVGCTDALRRNALVQIRRPAIAFPALPQAGCIPYNAKFSASINTLDKVTSYLWDLGDGTTSIQPTPTHTYANQGSYPVSLTVTTSTGCTQTFSLANAVVVGRKPIADFTAVPNPVCAYQNVFFSGTANEGDKWDWNFGDSTKATEQNPTHAYTDTGHYSVQMIVTNSGCADTVTKPAFITAKPPIAKFGVQKLCGQSNQLRFVDSSIGATTWFWNFGDSTTSTEQNPTHLFQQNGTYNVSLTVTNDTCSHTFSLPVSVFNVSPTFQADITEACKTAVINFASLVKDTADVISYNWQFGNGQTAVASNPQVTYTAAGNYSITLITTDVYGCEDTITKNNYIRINGPTAKFTASNNIGCKGLAVLFNDNTATDGQHSIQQWQWFYGDGQSDAFTNNTAFQHTYADTGKFSVQLIVTDSAGCKDSVGITNLVKTSAPNASFVSADTLNCLGSTVHFTNGTTSQNFTSQWNFGDSTFSTDKNPTHVYADTGRYDISLKITDVNGCSDSLAIPGYVSINKTIAAFSMSDSVGGCTPFNVQFTNNSVFYASSVWRFGRDSSVLNNPAYSFAVEGTYPITLVVKGRGGCFDSTKKTVVIYSDTATKFSYTPLGGCRPVLLSVSIKSPVNMTYAWYFGDGTLLTTKTKDTTHLFTNIGDFVPRLIVTDSGNCLLPLSGIDTVRVKGVFARFGADKNLFCDSGTVHFLDSTRYNEPTTYNWTFGDGSLSSETNPVHFYSKPGAYTVSLAAQTASLCKDTTTLQAFVKVVQSPRIAIGGQSVFCKDTAALNTGVYLQQDTSAVQWFWQFPSGNTSTAMQPAPQHYPTPGDYQIKAFAVNSSGCADSATKNIHINPLPSVSLPPTFTTAVGVPVLITPAIYSAGVVKYLWTPAAGLTCTTCSQPTAKPSFNTLYTVVATDTNGCQATAQVQVNVFCNNANVFVPNTFSPNGDGSNDVFYVRGAGLERIKSLRIFNRLGEVVFERTNFQANDASAGWDGTYKGRKLSPDTYIYQLDVFCENNFTIRRDGSITLIR